MADNDINKSINLVNSWSLGKTSAKFESGGKGAGAVSLGRGDHGGASYGTYQLSTKMGTLDKYLEQSSYATYFSGLTPGTSEFNSMWVYVANNIPGFGEDQHEFIKKSHYDLTNKNLKNFGIDLTDRGRAVQDSIWSTSVHIGSSAAKVIFNSLNKKFGENFDISTIADREIVGAIQEYKISQNCSLFRSSPNLWPGLLRRRMKKKLV